MQTRKCNLQTGLFPALLFVLIALTLNANQVNAQTDTSAVEKCVELSAGVEKFYKECHDEEFRNSFSPRIFDKFGIITLEDEWSRLHNFSTQLKVDPDTIGFIVIYGGRINKFGELNERAKRLTNHLVNDLKIDPKRVTVVQGGFRENFEFEFWLSRIKGVFPPLSPTVDVEKVVFKGKMKPLDTELGN